MLICEFLAAAAAIADDRATWPWAAGAAVASCQIVACDAHPEFYRCRLRCGPDETAVELVKVNPRQPAPQWSSPNYRLQPAPGATPPPQLLVGLLTRLRAWDRHAGPSAQVELVAAPRRANAAWPMEEMALLAICTLALLASTAMRVVVWTARNVAMAALPFAVGLAVAIAVRGLLVSAGVPVAWLTSLHEGTTAANVALLHGHNGHAGPLFAAIVHLCAAADAVTVRDIALTQAVVALAILSGCVTMALCMRCWVWVFALVGLALTPFVQLIAVSESEAAVATVWLIAAVPGLAVLARSGPIRDGRSVAAFALVAVCTALAGLVRTELAGFGLTALAWHGVRFARPDRQLAADARQLAAACARNRMAAVALGVVALATAWPVNAWVDPGARWTWFVAGIHPVNPTLLAAPALACGVFPAALCVVFALGVRRMLREHVVGWGWVLVAAIVLFRVWFAASHRVLYEIVRYNLGLVPIAAGLCALGATEATVWLRRWRPAWPRNAGLLCVAVAMASPVWMAPVAWVWPIPVGGLDDLPFLDRDQQAEVRALAETADRFAGCAWLTPIHPATERKGAGARTAWLAFGNPVRAPRLLTVASDPAASLRAVAPGASCGVLYRGLDCHLVAGPDCAAAERGRPMLWSTRRPGRTYADPIEYGQLRPSLEFAMFRLW